MKTSAATNNSYKQIGTRSEQGVPISTEPGLTFASRAQYVHDAVQVFNAGEFNAHTSLTGTEGDLDVRVQPVGERGSQVVQAFVPDRKSVV
jgi:hypothetical protein